MNNESSSQLHIQFGTQFWLDSRFPFTLWHVQNERIILLLLSLSLPALRYVVSFGLILTYREPRFSVAKWQSLLKVSDRPLSNWQPLDCYCYSKMYQENLSIVLESALKGCSFDDPILMGYLPTVDSCRTEHGLDPMLSSSTIGKGYFEWLLRVEISVLIIRFGFQACVAKSK